MSLGYINVQDYEAKGDGSTDDRPCIELAIAAAISHNIRHVYFPPGTYMVSQQGPDVSGSLADQRCGIFLEDIDGMIFSGAGRGVSTIKSLIRDGFTSAWRGQWRVVACRNLQWHDLTLDGGWTDETSGEEQIHLLEFNSPGNGIDQILTNPDGTAATVTVSNAVQFTVGQFYDFYPNKDRPVSDGAPSPSAVWTPTVAGILPLWEPRPGGPYELIARDLTTGGLTFATNLHESISNTSTRAPDQPAGEATGTGDWIVLANRHTEQMLIYNCAFQNTKGDGLHLQGEQINQVRFVTCHHCTFVNCKRGGIVGQRNTAWVDVHHCYVENVTDQALDMETSPSGNAQAPTGWKITHNVFKKVSGNASLLVGTDGLGTHDTQLGPYHRGGPTRDHVFAHNTVFGGSVRFFKAWNIQIHNNLIFGRDDGVGPSFDTLRIQSSENISVRDNIITRPSGSTDSGACIGIRTDSGGGIGNTENEGTWPAICKGLTVAGNHLYQYRPSTIIDIDAADGVMVDGNHLYFLHSGSATNIGVEVIPNGETADSGVTVNNIEVRGNVFHGGAAGGSLLAAVQVRSVSSSNSSVGKVAVTNNAGEGFETGAHFAGPTSGGGYTAQPVCYGNWWTATGVSDRIRAGVPGLISTIIGSTGYAVGPFQLIYDHTAATASRLTKLFKVPSGRTLQIEQVDYHNETGLVADTTNYFAIEIVKRARLVTAIDPTGGGESLTMVGHGFIDGDGPVFIVSDGTVQATAVETTQYWVHVIDADTISLAVSQANALAGTPRVNFTGTGGGATHRVMTKVSRRTTQSGGTNPDGWAAAAGSTIPPDTFVTTTMTTVDADKSFPAGTDVYLFLDEGGTATLPAGKVVIFGRYV